MIDREGYSNPEVQRCEKNFLDFLKVSIGEVM